LGLQLTYMQVRLLVDDLKVMPKDVDRPAPAELGRAGGSPSPGAPGPEAKGPAPMGAEPPAQAGAVSVTVDQIARQGAVVSGSVRFSDGQSAEWYLDQSGRLGLMPKQQGYRPSQQDVVAFQTELQEELARMGM
jgi:hypothetical protein